jgi:hypothetical protein
MTASGSGSWTWRTCWGAPASLRTLLVKPDLSHDFVQRGVSHTMVSTELLGLHIET